MKTAEEVWALLRSEVSARKVEPVSLADARGRTLRETVRANGDMPAFDRSAVDGFIVMPGDPSASFLVAGEISAGDASPIVLSEGRAFRVGTGALVPEGAEVIMLEDTAEEDGRMRIIRRGKNHVRRRGEDARAGDEMVRAGRTLTDGCIALLAGLGHVRPRVTRRITAHHVATGNEIVDPASSPGPAQVRDANSALVGAWAQGCGISLTQTRIGEDAPALHGSLRGDCDLLLVSGGASVGKHDFTESVLRAAGFAILVNKVNARPGKPLIVARRGDQWAFGLPGNPLSHFVCLHVFVSAALAAMNGASVAPVLLEAGVLAPIEGNPRETWWPATRERGGLCPLRWANSGDLTSLAAADSLVRVPVSGLAAGAVAEFIRTS